MEYLQGRVAKAEAMVASAEEAVHTLREGRLQSLRREEQLHDQVLELELHALALDECGQAFVSKVAAAEAAGQAAAAEVAAAEAAGQAETAKELEDAEFFEVFFADAVGWLLDPVDGEQLDAEEQARWEDIRSKWAEWHEVWSSEEEEEEESRPSLPSIPEGEAEPAEKVRCTSATCRSLAAWRSRWLGSCGCPFTLKEVAWVIRG